MTDDNGPQVDRWRDLLSPRYGYPDDLTETAGDDLSGRKRRRAVRDARKDWRERDRAARNEWLVQRRRESEDETTTAGRLVVLVVLALVLLGLMISGWLRASADGTATDGAPPSVNPVPTPAGRTTPAEDDQHSQDANPPSNSPNEASSAAAEVPEPATVAEQWAAAWFNFDPATQSATDRLESAATYQLSTLTDWLATQDTSASYYINHETTLSLDSAEVDEAPAGAPVDTATRVTVEVDVTTTMTPTEGEARTTVLPYVVTLERSAPEGEWFVGWFEEGSHE